MKVQVKNIKVGNATSPETHIIVFILPPSLMTSYDTSDKKTKVYFLFFVRKIFSETTDIVTLLKTKDRSTTAKKNFFKRTRDIFGKVFSSCLWDIMGCPALIVTFHSDSGESKLMKMNVSGWLNPSARLLKELQEQHNCFGRQQVKWLFHFWVHILCLPKSSAENKLDC